VRLKRIAKKFTLTFANLLPSINTLKERGRLSNTMSKKPSYQERFDALHTCVIVPTFNNAGTLAQVLEDVLQFTSNIIVVNDGSTDSTLEVLQAFPIIRSFRFEVNKGKGWALRKGFELARNSGFEYAITIDSDGQHFAKDLPVFLDKLQDHREAIIIGARNMDQTSIPGKSSFGHKFSNFWFKVETGISAPDTQSGYRLYPLLLLQSIRFVTRKYEFEIEVLVRAAWNGIRIEFVPVSVYYAPKETRISHFRPFKDFSRISVLNTVLVILTFVYIKPRNVLRALGNKKKRRQLLDDHILNSHQSDEVKAVSIAFGVFMGIIPIWGFQLATAIFLAIILKLNKALVIVSANISIPPMIPVIIFLSYRMGGFWMGSDATAISFSHKITLQTVYNNLQQYIYGSITFAVVAAIFFGLVSYLLLKIFKRNTSVVA
jgi:glycosyltransferase involved in cell wall biosynthesis